MIENKKTCTKCGDKKGLSKFHESSCHKYGVHSICIMCTGDYKEENKAVILQKAKEYYQKNKVWKMSPENDSYIRRLIVKNTKIKNIPHELIEAKRLQIQIKRHLKEVQQ